MPNALRFKQTHVLRQQGEQARLKVLQGPDYGSTYVVVASPVIVGRGEDSDIVISDLKASRKHIELSLTGENWAVRDLGSANGILYNGKSSRAASLKTGDTLTLGETTLEFFSSDAGTMLITAPAKSSGQFQAEQSALDQQIKKVRALGVFGSVGAAPGASGQGLLKNKKILYAVGAALVVLLLFGGEDSKPKKGKNKKGQENRDLASYLPSVELGGSNKTAEMFFKAGFREYRERNFIRAKSQFENVLQISPGHPLATIYLENCNKAIEEEVKFHLDRGKKSLEAGKLKESRGHFEAILRLLYRDQSNPSFAEAKEQLEKVNKAMRGESG